MDPQLKDTIDRAMQGDPAAFEAVIRQYARLLFSQVHPILHDPAEAEDVVQDAFLKAYKYRVKLREPEKFKAWLLAIAKNLARDRLRKRSRIVQYAEDIAFLTMQAPCFDKPADRIEHDETKGVLADVLAELPDHHRLAVEMRYLRDYSHEQIQQELGLGAGAVRGILNRAMSGLRRIARSRRQDF